MYTDFHLYTLLFAQHVPLLQIQDANDNQMCSVLTDVQHSCDHHVYSNQCVIQAYCDCNSTRRTELLLVNFLENTGGTLLQSGH